jgi:hypothetical protein
MAYMNDLRATHPTSGSATTRSAPSTWLRDPTRECFVCVPSASSSSTNPKPAPHHRATDAQHRAHLNELVEARRQLDEELANPIGSSGRTLSLATGSPLRCQPHS